MFLLYIVYSVVEIAGNVSALAGKPLPRDKSRDNVSTVMIFFVIKSLLF